MSRSVILLGAGASIDAGVPAANAMTRAIYESLDQPHQRQASRLFGYVIGKTIARSAKSGISPFTGVNVEIVYDTISRLIERDDDLLSDYVSGWDPVLDNLRLGFDADTFASKLQNAIKVERNFSRNTLKLERSKLREAGQLIRLATDPYAVGKDRHFVLLKPFLNALEEQLQSRSGENAYIDELVTFAATENVSIGSLNYDLIIEEAANRLTYKVDYGLDKWNANRVIYLNGMAAIRLLKIHGSINWTENGDTIEIDSKDNYYKSQGIIFGGAAGKLKAHGPYLHLRHRFETDLMKANRLLIVGYSFGDGHLNSLVARWVSTRERSRVIILKPDVSGLRSEIFKNNIVCDARGKILHYRCDIRFVRKTASEGMSNALSLLKKPISKITKLQLD